MPSAFCFLCATGGAQQTGVGVEKVDHWIHPWLGFWPGVWDRRVRNKDVEGAGDRMGPPQSWTPGSGWEGKEVQTGEGGWAGPLERDAGERAVW